MVSHVVVDVVDQQRHGGAAKQFNDVPRDAALSAHSLGEIDIGA